MEREDKIDADIEQRIDVKTEENIKRILKHAVFHYIVRDCHNYFDISISCGARWKDTGQPVTVENLIEWWYKWNKK
jgi:predicted transcriptional regulator